MSQESGLQTYETALARVGAAMTYPPTPDFTSRVFGELAARTEAGRRGGLSFSPRFALLALAGVVLAACAAAGAYYISGQNWLSSDPRGVQFSEEFELTRLFEASQDESVSVPYIEFASGGEDLFAVADPYSPDAAVVRVPQEPGAAEQEIVRFADLSDPSLWPQRADVENGVAPLCCEGRGMLAATPDGQVFVLASLLEESGEQMAGTPAALIVVRTDGSRQALASLDQLFAESGHDSAVWIGTSISAAVDGEVWLTSRNLGADGEAQFVWLLRDVNGDGDWSDVMVRRFEAPGLDEQTDPAEEDYYPEVRIAADPSAPGELLVNVRRDALTHEVHRLVDDGDFQLVLSTEAPTVATTVAIEPRTVPGENGEAIDELTAAGLSGPARVSRIDDDGEVTDIARAFGNISDIAVSGDGNIYVWAQEVDRPQTLALYELRQLAEGEEPAAGATVVGPATPEATGNVELPSAPGILYSRQQFDPAVQQVLFQPLAGGNPVQVLPGDHNASFCQSPGGRTLAYASDAEVPGELYLYVVREGEPVKATERQVGYWCLSDGFLLLTSDPPVTTPLDPTIVYFPGQGVVDPVIYDIESGEETALPDGVDRWLPSPEGDRILLVTIGDEGESLVSFAVESGESTVLNGPLDDGHQFSSLQWRADSEAVAYIIGPPVHEEREVQPGNYVLHQQDLEGEPEQVYEFEQQLFAPTVEASPSGDWFLAIVNTPVNCPDTVDLEAGSQCDQIELQLINGREGEASTVIANPGYLRDHWAPERDVFVFAEADPNFEDGLDEAFFVMEPGGPPRELLRTEPGSGRCPWCEGGFGWSDDGRYYGLVELGGVISVLDVETGRLTVLVDEPEDISVVAQWRRSPDQEDS
jgi:hypothetical protein